MKPNEYSVQRLNENSLLLSFSQCISIATSQSITHFNNALCQTLATYIQDTVPSYTTLLIVFDDDKICYNAFLNKLHSVPVDSSRNNDAQYARTYRIPILYNQKVGLDLAVLAEKKGLTQNEIIDYHCGNTYTVYAVGFTLGFAFLGEVNSRIAHPRRATPRQNVLAGSVGIAETQTGIYPTNSPGGWNIIGRTPLKILSSNPSNICPIRTGDKINFYPINDSTYQNLQGMQLGEHSEKN